MVSRAPPASTNARTAGQQRGGWMGGGEGGIEVVGIVTGRRSNRRSAANAQRQCSDQWLDWSTFGVQLGAFGGGVDAGRKARPAGMREVECPTLGAARDLAEG